MGTRMTADELLEAGVGNADRGTGRVLRLRAGR